MNYKNLVSLGALAVMGVTSLSLTAGLAQADDDSPQILPNPVTTVSTIPANKDVNPYGVAFVPNRYPQGTLQPDDILVSNFNNLNNLQGTGTTIVRITPKG
ncbi:MAG: hypothetical protein WAM39_04955, partial [Bryobacteraceae bacterium]